MTAGTATAPTTFAANAYSDQTPEGGHKLAQAVPGELPTPPAPSKTYAGNAMEWLADQVRQGVLPDEALAAIEKLPKPLEKALQEYHNAVEEDRTMWGERSGEPELYGDKLYKLATQHAAPE
jgi:hypothetical protein